MHPLMLKEVIARCRQRQSEGDCPTVPPFTVEQLEDAVIQLADELREVGSAGRVARAVQQFTASSVTLHAQGAPDTEVVDFPLNIVDIEQER